MFTTRSINGNSVFINDFDVTTNQGWSSDQIVEYVQQQGGGGSGNISGGPFTGPNYILTTNGTQTIKQTQPTITTAGSAIILNVDPVNNNCILQGGTGSGYVKTNNVQCSDIQANTPSAGLYIHDPYGNAAITIDAGQSGGEFHAYSADSTSLGTTTSGSVLALYQNNTSNLELQDDGIHLPLLGAGVLKKTASGPITSSTIVNSDVNAAAAIAYSKLALTNSIVNADINSTAGIVYSKLNLSNSIQNADINSGAAIAYSKLALNNSIVNSDINSTAAIAYSKLALSNSIVNADINSAAAIAFSKLTTMLNNTVLGNISGSTTTPSSVPVTNINTANTLVLRDGTGSSQFGTVSANQFIGPATQVNLVNETASSNFIIPFIDSGAPSNTVLGYNSSTSTNNLQINPSTGAVTIANGPTISATAMNVPATYNFNGTTMNWAGGNMTFQGTGTIKISPTGTTGALNLIFNNGNKNVNISTTDAAGTAGIQCQTTNSSATFPSYTFTGRTNYGMWSSSATTIDFTCGGINAIQMSSVTLRPATAGTVNCGTATLYWLAVNSQAYNTISDENKKHDIQLLTDHLGSDCTTFIRRLTPKSFRYNEGSNETVYGFISQDVEVALEDQGLDPIADEQLWNEEIINDDDGNYVETIQMLRLDNLHAPTIGAVKEIDARVTTLENTIQQLLKKIEILEGFIGN